VLQKATGLRTDRYAQERFFAALGISEVQWVFSPLNVPQTGGGLRLSSRDLLKIAQFYLNVGVGRERALLTQHGCERRPSRTRAATTILSTAISGG
jgi:CubicO group peptidase (beta-lactamase class C family)